MKMSIIESISRRAMNFISTDYRNFLGATRNPEKEQKKVLEKIVRENSDCVFGRDFNFKRINSLSDFQREVPIGDYNSLREYIDAAKKGAKKQLTSSPVLMFVLTSGTTSAAKFIPVTKEYIKAHREGSGVWTSSIVFDHPEIIGKILAIASPKVEGFTEAKIPFGAVTGLMYEQQGPLTNLFYVKSKQLFEIPEPETKYYMIAKTALEEENLTHIHTANPSTILKICQTIYKYADALIKDIYDGTISIDISENLRKKLGKRPKGKRAQNLDKLLCSGNFKLNHVWPGLSVIGCWKGGTQYLFLEKFLQYFEGVAVRDPGLIASEGRITIPLSDAGCSGVLDINHSFFEFIPEQEICEDRPETLCAWQLKPGEKYFVLMTTQSGLYRYDIRDLVEVTGFYNRTPEIRFLNKGAHISSIVGEKLTEHQVIEAYKETRKEGYKDEFLLYPKVQETGEANYIFLADFLVSQEFLYEFDDKLRGKNIEYASKRKSDRLGAIVSREISQKEFDELTKKNLNIRQFKFIYLMPNLDIHIPAQ